MLDQSYYFRHYDTIRRKVTEMVISRPEAISFIITTLREECGIKFSSNRYFFEKFLNDVGFSVERRYSKDPRKSNIVTGTFVSIGSVKTTTELEAAHA